MHNEQHTSSMPAWFDNLFKRKTPLKPPTAAVNDRSAPVVEKDTVVTKSAMPDDMKEELTSNAPALKKRLSIDRSAPVVESDVKVKLSPMGDLKKELKDKATEYQQAEAARDVLVEVSNAAPGLKPVEGAADRSAPVIESDVKLKRNSMVQLNEELKTSSPELKRVEGAADRSAPVVEADVVVKPSPMTELAGEITRRSSGALEVS